MYYKIKGYNGLIETVNLELAPITVFVGRNGSGKSSALSALNNFNKIFSIESYQKGNILQSFLSFPFPSTFEFGLEVGKEMEYTVPVVLSFFEDKFELRLKYKAATDIIYIEKFEIFNTTKKQNLLRIDTDSSKNNEGVLKINFEYLINEFFRLKKIKPFDWSEIKFEAPSAEQRKAFEEDLKSGRDKYFEDLVNTGFYEIKDIVKPIVKDTEEKLNLSLKKESSKFDSNNTELFALKRNDEQISGYEFINGLTSSLKENGINFDINESFSLPGLNILINSLLSEQSKHNLFDPKNIVDSSGFSKKSNYNNLLEVLDAQIEHTQLFNEIIDTLLFNNININISNCLKKNTEFTYIPPNRITKEKSNNESPVGFVLGYFKALRAAGFSFDSSSFYIDYWFKQFNISEDYIDIEAAIKILENNEDLNKEGYGIQQLIPLIVILSLSEKLHETDFLAQAPQETIVNRIKRFLIEEPEANLHPAFQSKLADLFLDAWLKYDHEFLVETHSEYLIRKLQYNVGSGKIDPSLINIYYFEKGKKPVKINIGKDGSLNKEFGQGFYDEADNLSIELFKLNKSYLN